MEGRTRVREKWRQKTKAKTLLGWEEESGCRNENPGLAFSNSLALSEPESLTQITLLNKDLLQDRLLNPST